MRENLFRGKGDKRYNDGVWYYGAPIRDYEGDWRICTQNLQERSTKIKQLALMKQSKLLGIISCKMN